MSSRLVSLLLCLLWLPSCADAVLEGSLSTVYRIDFDSLRVRMYSSRISVEYVKTDGSVPIRVTVDRDTAVGTAVNSDIDLLEHGDITGRTADDREIPRFSEGDIRFEQITQTEGGLIRGSFTAKFPAGETDVLGLKGFFEAELEVVEDPGPPPPDPPVLSDAGTEE